MKVLHGYRELKDKLTDPVIAIGVFDGIHIGHKRVINKVLNFPGRGRDRVIITFDPHPRTVLDSKGASPRIMSLEHRLTIFEKMGLDAVVVIKFTPFLASMTPEEFMKRILCGMNARTVYVGSNFHFGQGKKGNIDKFKELGKKYKIDVKAVPSVRKNRRIVSSTWLRETIAAGNIDAAEALLRRPVSVFGTVVGGDKRAKSLGAPTANIDPHHEVIPPPGVYAVKVDSEGKLYDGVLNVGFKPTFYGRKFYERKEPHVEVHLLDFKGNLYGKTLEIFFLKKLRKERKFKNEGKLSEQIQRDIAETRRILENRNVVHRIERYKYM